MRRRGGLHARSGVAALEFALVCPVLLACVGGLADFGGALADQSRLASAVALGAQYAYLHPSTVTAAAIQTLVAASASLPGMTVNATPPAYYCVTAGTPPTLTGASATTTCSDGTSAGSYVTITATYLYPAVMPGYSLLAGKTLTEAAKVRIQ